LPIITLPRRGPQPRLPPDETCAVSPAQDDEAGYDLGAGWMLSGGYRTVEGGADVESVHNFAWLHYAVLSLAWRR
jgi:hypothetical protein